MSSLLPPQIPEPVIWSLQGSDLVSAKEARKTGVGRKQNDFQFKEKGAFSAFQSVHQESDLVSPNQGRGAVSYLQAHGRGDSPPCLISMSIAGKVPPVRERGDSEAKPTACSWHLPCTGHCVLRAVSHPGPSLQTAGISPFDRLDTLKLPQASCLPTNRWR